MFSRKVPQYTGTRPSDGTEHKSCFGRLGFPQSLALFTLNSQGLGLRFFPVRLVECTMKDNGEIVRGTAIPLPLLYSRLQSQGKPKNLPSTVSSFTKGSEFLARPDRCPMIRTGANLPVDHY
jgi:hypothetical protein